ncbi:MAG: sulfurtransferase TusA family protein [Pseudomonadota bacterium]|nr:sulfurtransferase TusA family protein [Pseudomonadota bacterium]MED5407337.1 sulfurtransferase TusA family protein [Pseudomonadota bacterium]MEE3287173.1 sulfurtransferase TusA family protein [Pseudomonadota bacterium]
MSHQVLDARHLLCPLPVIRAQDRVKQLQPGDILEVRCTDPGALNDIPAWCRINGHDVLQAGEQAEEVVVTLRVGES